MMLLLFYFISSYKKQIVVAVDCRRARRARWQLAEAQQFQLKQKQLRLLLIIKIHAWGV